MMTFYKIAKKFNREKIFLLKTQNFLIANISTYMVIIIIIILFSTKELLSKFLKTLYLIKCS